MVTMTIGTRAVAGGSKVVVCCEVNKHPCSNNTRKAREVTSGSTSLTHFVAPRARGLRLPRMRYTGTPSARVFANPHDHPPQIHVRLLTKRQNQKSKQLRIQLAAEGVISKSTQGGMIRSRRQNEKKRKGASQHCTVSPGLRLLPQILNASRAKLQNG